MPTVHPRAPASDEWAGRSARSRGPRTRGSDARARPRGDAQRPDRPLSLTGSGSCSQRYRRRLVSSPRCRRPLIHEVPGATSSPATALRTRTCLPRALRDWVALASNMPVRPRMQGWPVERPKAAGWAAAGSRRPLGDDHSGVSSIGGRVRSSWARRSGSTRASIWVIFPFVTVKAITENSRPSGTTMAPAAPLTIARLTNG